MTPSLPPEGIDELTLTYAQEYRLPSKAGNKHAGRYGPKRIVEEGYDRIADRYAAWTGRTLQGPRARYISLLVERISRGAEVLELGCATGIPTTRELVKHFSVTGVDISAKHIGLAKQQVPEAKFKRADITPSSSRT